jgi:hypothetical protein
VKRAELGALRDAIDTILNWPDSVRDQIAAANERLKTYRRRFRSHVSLSF